MIDLPSLAPGLAALAEADPEREVCGFVVADSRGAQTVLPVRNVAGETAAAYEIDPAAHLALARSLRDDGGRIVAVYHSHIDGPARLSAADLEGAVDGDLPVLPGTDQVVIGMESGKTLEVRVLRWKGSEFRPLAAWTPATARRVAPGAP